MKKNRFGRILKYLILGIIIMILIFRVIPSPLSGSKRTITAQNSELVDGIMGEAVIIKNEEVFLSGNIGNLEMHVEEGSRVAAGTHLATLTSSGDGSVIEEELRQLDQSIRELNEAREETENISEETNIEDIIASIKIEIQESIRDGKLDQLNLLKERLNNLKLYGQVGETESSNETIEKLEIRRNQLSEELNRNVKDFYSSHGGILTYRIDGSEEKYLAKDFEGYSYDKIDMEANKTFEAPKGSNKIIEINEPMFKLIDNFRWYLGIKIEDLQTIESIKDEKFLSVNLDDFDYPMQGRVITINKFKNKGVIILELTNHLHDIYDRRFTKVQVIKSDIKGLKVPKSVLTKKDDQNGVYIKDLGGIVKFRPVKILGEDDSNYYMKKGDENDLLELEDGDNAKTITIFDEIFLNPNSVREGKIIN